MSGMQQILQEFSGLLKRSIDVATEQRRENRTLFEQNRQLLREMQLVRAELARAFPQPAPAPRPSPRPFLPDSDEEEVKFYPGSFSLPNPDQPLDPLFAITTTAAAAAAPSEAAAMKFAYQQPPPATFRLAPGDYDREDEEEAPTTTPDADTDSRLLQPCPTFNGYPPPGNGDLVPSASPSRPPSDGGETGTGRARRKRHKRYRGKGSVPKTCSYEVRKKYKYFLKKGDFVGFNMNERLKSPHNQRVCLIVRKALKEARSMFTDFEINCALKTFYKTRKYKQRKEEKGKTEEHRLKCRRQARLRDKVDHLKKGLDKIAWTQEEKARAKKVLCIDYMSSEESDYEIADGTRMLCSFKVRRLPWEGVALRNLKQQLEAAFIANLSPGQLRRQRLPRILSNTPSTRLPPRNAPEWALTVVKTEKDL